MLSRGIFFWYDVPHLWWWPKDRDSLLSEIVYWPSRSHRLHVSHCEYFRSLVSPLSSFDLLPSSSWGEKSLRSLISFDSYARAVLVERSGYVFDRSQRSGQQMFSLLQRIKRKLVGEEGRCRCYERQRAKVWGNWILSHTHTLPSHDQSLWRDHSPNRERVCNVYIHETHAYRIYCILTIYSEYIVYRIYCIHKVKECESEIDK